MFGWMKNKRTSQVEADFDCDGDEAIPSGAVPDDDDAELLDDSDTGNDGGAHLRLLEQVNSFTQSGKSIMADASQMAETYRACQEISRDIEAIKAKRDVELARIVAGFKICSDVIDRTFGERADALEKHYQTLDKALESGNNELVIAALQGISGIVTTSPLKSFEQEVDELMKIKRDDVLELDF